jgi:ribosome maturation factor RimP
MLREDREARLRERVQALLRQSDLELVDVELTGSSRGFVVRVLVDKPGGVSVEDCARVSRAVGDDFEAAEAIPGRYILEVSSPGIDRPLKRREDFERFVGERAEVITVEMIGEQRDHRGTLAGFDAATDSVMIALESGSTVAIPLGAIRRAHLRRDPWGKEGGKGHADNPRNAGGSWNAKPRRVKKKR